jgi:hypothetical protein
LHRILDERRSSRMEKNTRVALDGIEVTIQIRLIRTHLTSRFQKKNINRSISKNWLYCIVIKFYSSMQTRTLVTIT